MTYDEHLLTIEETLASLPQPGSTSTATPLPPSVPTTASPKLAPASTEPLSSPTCGCGGARETSGPMLTRRQRELVRLVARGLDRHEIAQELWVSPNTVKSHLLRLYKLVRVKNGAGLTTYGFTQGLLDPNEYR